MLENTLLEEAPLASLVCNKIVEDIPQVQDIGDESLPAPADIEDQDGWEKWQSAIEDATDEKYFLLADESIMQDISFMEQQLRKGKVGLHNDRQLFGEI